MTPNEHHEISLQSGVPIWVAIVLMVLFVGSLFAHVYQAYHPPKSAVCEVSNAVQAAEISSAKEQMKYDEANQKHVFEVQMEVVKACVSRGDIPIWHNSNVECTKR